MAPRWFDGENYLVADTGGGPLPRLWATALGGLVDTPHAKSTGHSVLINLPRTMTKPEVTFEWKIPQWSNALERNRARTENDWIRPTSWTCVEVIGTVSVPPLPAPGGGGPRAPPTAGAGAPISPGSAPL